MLSRHTQCRYRPEASFCGSEGARLPPHAGTRLADAVYVLLEFFWEEYRNRPYTAKLDGINSRHVFCQTWPLHITCNVYTLDVALVCRHVQSCCQPVDAWPWDCKYLDAASSTDIRPCHIYAGLNSR